MTTALFLFILLLIKRFGSADHLIGSLLSKMRCVWVEIPPQTLEWNGVHRVADLKKNWSGCICVWGRAGGRCYWKWLFGLDTRNAPNKTAMLILSYWFCCVCVCPRVCACVFRLAQRHANPITQTHKDCSAFSFFTALRRGRQRERGKGVGDLNNSEMLYAFTECMCL